MVVIGTQAASSSSCCYVTHLNDRLSSHVQSAVQLRARRVSRMGAWSPATRLWHKLARVQAVQAQLAVLSRPPPAAQPRPRCPWRPRCHGRARVRRAPSFVCCPPLAPFPPLPFSPSTRALPVLVRAWYGSLWDPLCGSFSAFLRGIGLHIHVPFMHSSSFGILVAVRRVPTVCRCNNGL